MRLMEPLQGNLEGQADEKLLQAMWDQASCFGDR